MKGTGMTAVPPRANGAYTADDDRSDIHADPPVPRPMNRFVRVPRIGWIPQACAEQEADGGSVDPHDLNRNLATIRVRYR